MSYQQAQLHLIRTVVQLKKVAITVRFPCSISFALKTQNSLSDHKAVYQLTKGQSIINQTIQIQVEVPFVKGRYEEKKVSLLIFMVSANGRIPAGTVTINPTEKIILDKKAPLEKCPDKNAEVTYTESWEKVRVVRQITESRASRNNLAASNVSGYGFLNRSQVQYASTANLVKNESNAELKPYEEESRRSQIERNGYRSNDGNSLRNSQVGSQSEKKYFNRFAKNRADEVPKRSLYGTGQKDNFQMRMSRASNQVAQGLEWQVQSQKSKILKLQQEKTGYIKQIVKLKGSLVRVQSEERFHIEDQFNRVKTQKSELQEEVQKLKEKTKYQEKKQRQSGSMLKQLREELDKKKSRIIQLDSSKTQIQSQLMQKDRIISSLQSEKKKLQQCLEQEKAVQQSFQKRLELKQNSYKDQIKKISDKYAQSESERQKAMLDYNNLLLQIQNAEKRNQTLVRDKQKSYNEEKNKLNKKIEQLLAEVTDTQEKLSDKINHIRDLEYTNKKIGQQEREKQQKYSNLKQQYDDLNIKVKSLQQQKKALSQQIRNIQNALIQEKSTNKKKYMDCYNELGVLKEKYQKITMVNGNLQQKTKDLQSRLQKQTKDKAVLSIKLDELKKAQQKYLQDEQTRERLAETLSIENISQNNKLSEFKSRIQSERRKYQTMQTKYEQQVQYLVRSKEQLQGEAEELKWLLESEIKKSQTLNAKYRQSNDQIIELSQKIIKNQEEFVRLDEEKAQLNSKISSLELEIAHLKNNNKALTQSLKKKQEDYYTIQKKGSSQEQELYIIQNRLQNTIKDLKNRIDTLENDISLKNNKLKESEQELIMMGDNLVALRAVQAKQKSQISNKTNEILGLKESNQVLQSDFMGLLGKNEKLQQQLNDKQEQIEELLRKINENKSQYQSLSEQNNNRKVQFRQYKQSFRSILQQFFNHWNQQQYYDPNQLKILPDAQLAQLQTVCSKKIFANYQRQQEKMKAQARRIQQLSQSNMKLKDQLQQLRNEHANKLSTEIHSQKIIKVEKDQQIAMLNARIDELVTSNEEKSSQIQFLNSSVSKYQEMIAEFTEESLRNHKTHSNLLMQIDVLERQIFEYKEKEVKSKLMSSTQSEELKHLIKQERQRYEGEVKSLKQAILGKQKQLGDKVEQIKRWVLVESQMKMQQAKYIQENQELSSKLSQQSLSKKTLQRSLQQRQRVIKELQDQMSNLKANLQFQRNKQKHGQEQLKRLQNEIHHLQIKSKSIEQQHRFKHSSTQQTQRRQRERRQKLQAAKAKLEQQNKQVRQKCVKLESEVQFYKFYKEQSSKKIAQYEKMKEASFMEMIKYKQSVLKSQKQIGNYENKHYKLQMEIEHITRQKQLLAQTNNKLKQRLEDYQEKAQGYNEVLNELESRDRQISRLKDNIKTIQQQNDRIVQELKNSLAKYKEESASNMTRIKQLEAKLQDKNSDLNAQRQKIMAQYQGQRSMYQIKLQTYQENMRVLQQQMEFQKEQSTREIQGANSIIQELNQVIRQKQEHLQSREQIINEQNVRLEELNLQLIQCVNKWQKEKEAYVPASTKLTEINEELLRMNKFMGELDGRNKQLLQINKRKMQQTLQNKPSITEILKEFYIVMQKSKNKILNRCQTQKEKEAIMQEFKVVQEKLDLTLKSTQIVTLKQ